MKVKRKKYEPLEVVFKDKARKIGHISTKAEKKKQSTRQKGSLCSIFQEICAGTKSLKIIRNLGIMQCEKILPQYTGN